MVDAMFLTVFYMCLFLVFLNFFRLMMRFWCVCFHLEEDVTDLAGLIFAVVQFLDEALLGGSDLGELFIGLDIGQLSKLFHSIPLLHIKFLHAALLDLLAEIGQREPEQSEGGCEFGKEEVVFGDEGTDHGNIISCSDSWSEIIDLHERFGVLVKNDWLCWGVNGPGHHFPVVVPADVE